MTKEEKINKLETLKNKSVSLKKEVDYWNAFQLSLKLVLNGSYGAFSTSYFIMYSSAVSSSITAEGRRLTQTMEKVNNDYWYNQWFDDKELHKNLSIRNVSKIANKIGVSVYADTDSCFSDTEIHTSNGSKTIEEWYNENTKNGSAGETIKGHESVLTNDKILNWSEENNLYYTNVKRIIRHKVSKPKWKLKTKNGKEIIVTNDHSMIVFRDGFKLEIKPSEILKTDKILIVYEN